MLERLTSEGIDCDFCRERPFLRETLGCGVPPSRDDDPDEVGWTEDEDDESDTYGTLISPFARVQKGRPAWERYGEGAIVTSWRHCPRYEYAFSDMTCGDELTWVAIHRAHRFHQRGELSALYPDPDSRPPNLIALIDLYDALDQQRQAEERRELTKALAEGLGPLAGPLAMLVSRTRS